MKATLQGSDETGYITQGPPDPEILALLVDAMAPLRPSRPEAYATGEARPMPTSVGSHAEVLMELAWIKVAIRGWHRKQPDEVIREASAYSARLTELWTELRILESYDRQFTQLRTMQVGPVLDEVDRQYRFAQSRIAMSRQDLDLNRTGA